MAVLALIVVFADRDPEPEKDVMALPIKVIEQIDKEKVLAADTTPEVWLS